MIFVCCEFLIVAQQDLKIQKPVSVRSELSLFSTFSIAFTRERQHVRVLNYSRTVSAIVFRPPSKWYAQRPVLPAPSRHSLQNFLSKSAIRIEKYLDLVDSYLFITPEPDSRTTTTRGPEQSNFIPGLMASSSLPRRRILLPLQLLLLIRGGVDAWIFAPPSPSSTPRASSSPLRSPVRTRNCSSSTLSAAFGILSFLSMEIDCECLSKTSIESSRHECSTGEN